MFAQETNGTLVIMLQKKMFILIQDVIDEIISYSSHDDLLSMRLICRDWNEAITQQRKGFYSKKITQLLFGYDSKQFHTTNDNFPYFKYWFLIDKFKTYTTQFINEANCKVNDDDDFDNESCEYFKQDDEKKMLNVLEPFVFITGGNPHQCKFGQHKNECYCTVFNVKREFKYITLYFVHEENCLNENPESVTIYLKKVYSDSSTEDEVFQQLKNLGDQPLVDNCFYVGEILSNLFREDYLKLILQFIGLDEEFSGLAIHFYRMVMDILLKTDKWGISDNLFYKNNEDDEEE